MQWTDPLLVDYEAGHVKFCESKLTLLICVRRIAFRECIEKRVDFAFFVSIAVADEYDVVEKVCDVVDTMSNLAKNLLEAGWCWTKPERDPFPLIEAIRIDHRCDVKHRRIQFDLPVACFEVVFGEFCYTCEKFAQPSIVVVGICRG